MFLCPIKCVYLLSRDMFTRSPLAPVEELEYLRVYVGRLKASTSYDLKIANSSIARRATRGLIFLDRYQISTPPHGVDDRP